MKKIISAILLLFLNIAFLIAQPLLTADSAVSISLKNNFDILIARNNADIDKVNNIPGNAGMLPTFAAVGSDVIAKNNYYQNSASGSGNTNAQSNALNAGIALNWTVFDGGKMFVTKNKLNQIQALGEIQYKDKVMQTIYNVVVAYYDVVRQKQQLLSINEAITYNKELVKILLTSFNSGLSPKTNLLQAQVDLNVFMENAINQQAVIIASKRNLNQLLSRDSDISFDVSDSIPLNYTPDRNKLIQKLDSSNTSILVSQKQVDISKLSINEFKTARLPKINFNAGYNLAYSNNSSIALINSRPYGPSIGASITIPLYQAGVVNSEVNTAKIQLQSSSYNLENTKVQVNVFFQNALTDFDNQKQLLTIEKDNDALAKENLDISTQRLKYGQTTLLEVRQAQSSYVDSRTRLINFEYNLKVAETKLKQLMAEL
jgi:outer membrane protein